MPITPDDLNWQHKRVLLGSEVVQFMENETGILNTHGHALMVLNYNSAPLCQADPYSLRPAFPENSWAIFMPIKELPDNTLSPALGGSYVFVSREGDLYPVRSPHLSATSVVGSLNQTEYLLRMIHAFGLDHTLDPVARDMRFGEEAIELLQARGRSKAEVLRLVDYVYNRDIGEVEQEMAGVLTTLMAMATQNNTDLCRVTHMEERRFSRANVKISTKSANKPDLCDRSVVDNDKRSADVLGKLFQRCAEIPAFILADEPELCACIDVHARIKAGLTENSLQSYLPALKVLSATERKGPCIKVLGALGIYYQCCVLLREVGDTQRAYLTIDDIARLITTYIDQKLAGDPRAETIMLPSYGPPALAWV